MSIDASITQSAAFDGWRAPSFNERCTFLFFLFFELENCEGLENGRYGCNFFFERLFGLTFLNRKFILHTMLIVGD